MAEAILEELANIRRIAHVTDADIARAAGVADSTARLWRARLRLPGREREERILEFSMVVERLRRVMAPKHISLWLRKPRPDLDDEKPLDVIAKGDYRSVSRIVAGLESPPAS